MTLGSSTIFLITLVVIVPVGLWVAMIVAPEPVTSPSLTVPSGSVPPAISPSILEEATASSEPTEQILPASPQATSSKVTPTPTLAVGSTCRVPCTGAAPDPAVVEACREFSTQSACTAYTSDAFPYRCAWRPNGSACPDLP